MKKNMIIGDLEVFYRDLPNRSFQKGQILCSALKGEGWRIPSLKELGYLFDLHKKGILGFDPTGIYWSDRKKDTNMNAVINFSTGSYSQKNIFSEYCVRPVRTIKP